jgi:hypothetical protein
MDAAELGVDLVPMIELQRAVLVFARGLLHDQLQPD